MLGSDLKSLLSWKSQPAVFFKCAHSAYLDSCRINGSFPAKAHQLLKVFASENTAEGELASV